MEIQNLIRAMQKSFFLVCLLVFPYLSWGQSKKKLNEQLRYEYTRMVGAHDSIVGIGDSVLKRYELARFNYSDQYRKLIQLIDVTGRVQRELRSNYRDMELLEVTTLFAFTKQSFDTIDLPEPFYPLQFTDYPSAIGTYLQPWVDYSGWQNLRLKEQNAKLDQLITFLYHRNTELVTVQEKLTAHIVAFNKDSERYHLKEQQLSASLYNFQQKLSQVRAEKVHLECSYATSGPEGFSEAYAIVFPKVFATDRDVDHVVESFAEEIIEPVELPAEKRIFDVPEEDADFPGGAIALKAYLKEHIVYPISAKEKGIQGKCYLKFVVSDLGVISNIKVLRGVTDCSECDLEAIRVVQLMPLWVPGKINGKAVDSYYNLPVQFKFD